MSIELRKSTQEDYEYVMAHPINSAVTKHFEHLKVCGWCKTALLNGRIMGIGGCVSYWEGFAEGFYCLTEDANEHKVEMVFCIKKVVDAAFEELKLHRLQATVRVDFLSAIKLIEHCGFKKEGLMKMYTEDKIDTFLYALVRD